jgi:hypothetical protein
VVNNRTKESKYGYSYTELAFDNWKEIRNYLVSWEEHEEHELSTKGIFLFRGHSDSTWELEPTLERIRPDLEDNFAQNWYIAAEKRSVENYKRAIKIFLNDKENRYITNDITQLEWLSIMQHHGAATRLLDVTRSPLIAAFFACTDVKCITKERCIWAIPLWTIDIKNNFTLRPETEDKSQELYDYYQNVDIVNKDEKPIIGYTFLSQLSERPFYQQGAFLYSMSNTVRFTNLLKNYYVPSTKLTKLTFKFSDRRDFAGAINDLQKMNISYSSLFPGIDGYSKDIFLYQYIVND